MEVHLPDWPWRIVLQLAGELGARVWAVGGSVRDALLSMTVHDWDFAVQGDSLGLARAAADRLGGGFFTLDAERETGRVIAEDLQGEAVEIDFAALRGENLEDDLAARDFTINALAVDSGGTLVDCTSGVADLEAGLIRATADTAFQDDPVRLLRAMRLEAQLAGFTIEDQTVAWIERDGALLGAATPERIRDEMVRLLEITPAVPPIERLESLGLLAQVLPELVDLQGVAQSPPHRFDVYHHSLLVLDSVERALAAAMGREAVPGAPTGAPAAVWGSVAGVLGQFASDLEQHLSLRLKGGRDRSLLMKLAALLHDVGKAKTYSYDDTGTIIFDRHDAVGAEMAARRMAALHFSREEGEQVRRIVAHHLLPSRVQKEGELDRRAVFRYFRRAGDGGVELALCSLADLIATFGPELAEERLSRRLETVETLLISYFEHYEETIAPAPLVSGDELMVELEIPRGPEIGLMLERLLEAQAAGEISERSEALALARRLHRRA
jgi:putative nucleotidyltransferase with HDIG domain